MDDRIELINHEIARCRRKIILLQAREVGDQTSFTVEGKTINVVWNLIGGAGGDSVKLNMISNIPEFRELVRKIEDDPITIKITSIGGSTVSFNVGNELSYTMFAPVVCKINGKKILFSWNGNSPVCAGGSKARSDMIAEMSEFTQWLDTTSCITEPIEIKVERIDYSMDKISFIAFRTNDHKQYYFESNYATVHDKNISMKHYYTQTSVKKCQQLETMREFKLWVKDINENTDSTIPIEISIDRLYRSDQVNLSFIAFKTSDGKKYYLYIGMNDGDIHSIATGRQIVENFDDLVGECKITSEFSEIPELNRMRRNTLKILRKKINYPRYTGIRDRWNSCLSGECVMVLDKLGTAPELKKKFIPIVMEMIKVQMEESKTQLSIKGKDALMGEYTITVRYHPSIRDMELIGDVILRNVNKLYQEMTTNEVSERIKDYNKNVENIVLGYRSQLKGDQVKNNGKRHTQSGNTFKQLKQTLNGMLRGENEDKTIIIQYQIKAIELMQIHLREVLGNGSIRTNKPPPTKDLIAWLSETQDL
jgi:hypothetical protein